MPPEVDPNLKPCLLKYQNPKLTLLEIVNVRQEYRGLYPRMDTFVFSNGTQKELVMLDGTIPVEHKGIKYHIPICIWILDNHPNKAPICFVKPTLTMNIKTSLHVDHNGRIRHPYLHNWKPPESNLMGLIKVLIVVFGDMPPVYTQPQGGAAIKPHSIQTNMPMFQNGNLMTKSVPPLPGQSYQTASAIPREYAPDQNHLGEVELSSCSPYPPYPLTGSMSQLNSSVTPSHLEDCLPYPQTVQTQMALADGTGTIPEEHIREKLLSEVAECLLYSLGEKLDQAEEELKGLRRTRKDLLVAQSKMEVTIREIEVEEFDLGKDIAILQHKEVELKKARLRFSKTTSFQKRLNKKEEQNIGAAKRCACPVHLDKCLRVCRKVCIKRAKAKARKLKKAIERSIREKLEDY